MVRAGVVVHPQEWPCSEYNEIQKPRERCGLIDHDKLMDLAGLKSRQDLERLHKAWIDEGASHA
jgi:putative transposase